MITKSFRDRIVKASEVRHRIEKQPDHVDVWWDDAQTYKDVRFRVPRMTVSELHNELGLAGKLNEMPIIVRPFPVSGARYAGFPAEKFARLANIWGWLAVPVVLTMLATQNTGVWEFLFGVFSTLGVLSVLFLYLLTIGCGLMLPDDALTKGFNKLVADGIIDREGKYLPRQMLS